MSLGENLKARRRACHMTVEEVATRLGVSRQTVFRYENGGIATVPSAKLLALAEIYGTTPSVLLGGGDTTDAPTLRRIDPSTLTEEDLLLASRRPMPTVLSVSSDPYTEEGEPLFRCDGWVHVEDEGMQRLRMSTGDIVAYEHKAPDNGKLAVIRLDGKTVVRRYYNNFPEEGTLTLVPDGVGETLVLSGEEKARCELLGHALFFRVPVEQL